MVYFDDVFLFVSSLLILLFSPRPTAALSTTALNSEGQTSFKIISSEKLVTTWYQIVGNLSETTKIPLVTLHGGPGAGHDYFSPLIELYEKDGIPVILYDQVGSGKNTHFPEKSKDESFWTVDLFIQEIDNLVDALGLRQRGFHILGHSWGGMLAGSYASRRPEGLAKVVISSAPASASLHAESMQFWLSQLPDKVRDPLVTSSPDSEEYQNAEAIWAKKHFCNIDSIPEDILNGIENLKQDPTVYQTMQGPSEWEILGSLRDWEGWSQAHNIEAETLLTNGRYDQTADLAIQPWFKHIPKVKWVVFQNATHMAHWEEREHFISVVGNFLMDR